MKLKKEIDNLIETSFDNNLFFQEEKNKAFLSLMNKEHYARQLANYCDYEMKIGLKGLNEVQIEEKINNIISLFKCLYNKMLFQYEFSKKLTDRLLSGKTQSMIAEELLITKLKLEQGVSYVSKMTSMLQDLDNSKLIIDNYRMQNHRGLPFNIHFTCQVLQNGAWDIEKYRFDKFNISPILQKCIDDFTSFYTQRQKSHKLNLVFGHGNLEIKYSYLKKPYQSISTLLQYSILILLEKYDKKKENVTCAELSVLLNTSLINILNEVNGLIFHPSFNPKKEKNIGVVLASTFDDKNELTGDSVITINKDFTANSLKINTIPVIIKRPNANEEEQKDTQNINSYQNVVIDSILTKIMKSRIGQETTHQYLNQQVITQVLVFKATQNKIKERIEALIEKGILKRNDDNRNVYNYIS